MTVPLCKTDTIEPKEVKDTPPPNSTNFFGRTIRLFNQPAKFLLIALGILSQASYTNAQKYTCSSLEKKVIKMEKGHNDTTPIILIFSIIFTA